MKKRCAKRFILNFRIIYGKTFFSWDNSFWKSWWAKSFETLNKNINFLLRVKFERNIWRMGGLRQFIIGSSMGCVFIYLLPPNAYRSFKRNFGKPLSKELNKREIDLLKVTTLTVAGVQYTFEDIVSYFKRL